MKGKIKREYLIVAVLLLLIGFIGFKSLFSKAITSDVLLDDVRIESTSPSLEESEPLSKLYVDIKGAVKLPGMYEVTSDMRVLHVIDMAGGLTNQADEGQINFAQKVEDQMIIYIPKEGEEIPESLAIATNSQNGTKEEDSKVNLNTATKEELMSLNGVGEKKAEKIIDYREENGSFKTIEELKNVNGFGEKSFDSLSSYITI